MSDIGIHRLQDQGIGLDRTVVTKKAGGAAQRNSDDRNGCTTLALLQPGKSSMRVQGLVEAECSLFAAGLAMAAKVDGERRVAEGGEPLGVGGCCLPRCANTMQKKDGWRAVGLAGPEGCRDGCAVARLKLDVLRRCGGRSNTGVAAFDHDGAGGPACRQAYQDYSNKPDGSRRGSHLPARMFF